VQGFSQRGRFGGEGRQDMNLFFDTSALVKFFHEEKGSETVTNLILSKDNEMWISELTKNRISQCYLPEVQKQRS
jgi:PIN domain nuclease of toxin-antitoxin system